MGPIHSRGKRVTNAAGPSATRAPARRSQPNPAMVTARGQHLAMLNGLAVETFRTLTQIQREVEQRQAALSTHQREAAQQAAQQDFKTAVLAAGVKEIKAQAAQAWERYTEVLKVMKRCGAYSVNE